MNAIEAIRASGKLREMMGACLYKRMIKGTASRLELLEVQDKIKLYLRFVEDLIQLDDLHQLQREKLYDQQNQEMLRPDDNAQVVPEHEPRVPVELHQESHQMASQLS